MPQAINTQALHNVSLQPNHLYLAAIEGNLLEVQRIWEGMRVAGSLFSDHRALKALWHSIRMKQHDIALWLLQQDVPVHSFADAFPEDRKGLWVVFANFKFPLTEEILRELIRKKAAIHKSYVPWLTVELEKRGNEMVMLALQQGYPLGAWVYTKDLYHNHINEKFIKDLPDSPAGPPLDNLVKLLVDFKDMSLLRAFYSGQHRPTYTQWAYAKKSGWLEGASFMSECFKARRPQSL